MARVMVPSLKSWQLKYWAFLTGLTSAGTKAELQAVLQGSLDCIRSSTTTRPAKTFVSVDMGIRNLAYCVVHRPIEQELLTVTAWKRMDLLKSPASFDAASSNAEVQDTAEDKAGTRRKNIAVLDKTAFTPSVLSKTAYSVTQALLQYEPDEILIERQRFRSGGAAAIQEWTVRVNMLESMLWACFETLRASKDASSSFPVTLAINPRRVADFWTAGREVLLYPPKDIFRTSGETTDPFKLVDSGRKKVEKSDKVGIVRSWISGNSDVRLKFVDEAASIAEAFSMEKGKSRAARELAGGKLDDLADCLLQAIAHVRWQENQERIYQMLEAGT